MKNDEEKKTLPNVMPMVLQRRDRESYCTAQERIGQELEATEPKRLTES